MLLMALAPSISRLLSTDATSSSGWSAMCTMAGLKWVKAATPVDDVTPEAPSPAMADCAYCLLLASLPLVLLALCLWFPRPAPGHERWRWETPRLRVAANLRGIGGQGPPIAL